MSALSVGVRVGLVWCAAALLCAVWAAPARGQGAAAGPALEIVGGEVDLGFMTPGEPVRREIRLRNVGDRTVRVERVTRSCPCLAAFVDDGKAGPGEELVLSLWVDPLRELGPFDKRLGVHVVGMERPFVIELGGEISLAVRVTQDGLAQVEGERGVVRVESLDGSAFRVLSVNAGEAGVEVPGGAAAVHELRYDWSGMKAGERPRWFVVETDHPGAGLVEVIVNDPAQWEPWRPVLRWRWFEGVKNVGEVEAGSWFGFSARLTGTRFREGARYEVRGEGMEVELVEAREPRDSGGVELVMRGRFPADARGAVHGVVWVRHKGEESGLDVWGVARAGGG